MAVGARAGFLRYFESLPDPRMKRTRKHELADRIVIAICAIICGADGWAQVAAFGRAKRKWFETFLNLPNGIPSHDTFGRRSKVHRRDEAVVAGFWPTRPIFYTALPGFHAAQPVFSLALPIFCPAQGLGAALRGPGVAPRGQKSAKSGRVTNVPGRVARCVSERIRRRASPWARILREWLLRK